MGERVVRVSVVIIGAGVAGLTAADQFIKEGMTDFLILEATDRIGGRVLSLPKESEDAPNIEIGAEWIHGIHGNPVYDLAKKHKLFKVSKPCRKRTPGRNTNLALSSEGSIISEEIVKEVFAKFHEVRKKVLSQEHGYCDETIDASQDTSLGNLIKQEMEGYLKGFPPRERRLREIILQHRFQWETATVGCSSMDDVSISLFRSYLIPRGPNLPFPAGYRKLTHFLFSQIPHDKILLSHPVSTVDYTNFKTGTTNNNISESNLCKIYCGKNVTVYCDCILVTCSLGFLKEKAETLFMPKLPTWKMDALQSMGMGTVNKIFLEFSNLEFMPKKVRTLLFIWKRDELICESPDMQRNWVKSMDNMYTYHNRFLRGWISGEGAKAMEKLSDEEVLHDLWSLLKRLLGKDTPKPVRVIRSRWYSEAYVRGSYSYPRIGASMATIEDLAAPVTQPHTQMPVIFFAGEATHPIYFSTTHGALLSGLREARNIMTYLHKT